MTAEEWLHNVGPDVIKKGDQFYIGSEDMPGLAIALTDCTIATHPDGRQQCVLMVEIPTTHKFDTIIRGRE